MGTLFIDTGGATTNSGCTDQNAANLTGAAATVAGSVVTLDGSPDLSGLITSGASQSSIFLSQATNANTKIFWITAFDNVAKTVTVSVAPTGVVSSAWAIGGRFHLGATGSPANASIEGALRAGDTVQFNNSPAAQNAAIWTMRNAGDSTSGFCKVIGKAGVTVTLNSTGTTSVINSNVVLSWFENLTIDQDGATGTPVNMQSSATGAVLYNLRVIDGGGDGITLAAGGQRAIGCSVAGVGGSAINITSGSTVVVYGCFLRSGGGSNGITLTSTTPGSFIVNNVIAAAVGRGIIYTGAATAQSFLCLFMNNTVYGSGNSGFEITDADVPITMIGNIFMNNGNAAGEANIEWAAGNGQNVSFHGWNMLFNGSGADAPINWTADAQVPGTEFLTDDPLFVNAGAGNFALDALSPAIGIGFPQAFLGNTLSLGYPALGAVQPAGTGVTPDSGAADPLDIGISISI